VNKKQIIEYVESLIDEVSPSGAVQSMGYNKTIEEIMQSVADEYAVMYPTSSPITKAETVKTGTTINNRNDVKGTQIEIKSDKFPKYAKFRSARVFDGEDEPVVYIESLLPVNSKERKFIDGNNLASMPTSDAVAFYSERAGGSKYIDLFPEIEGFSAEVFYDAYFDPSTYYTNNKLPDGDRGFFDAYCWYLAFRSMQVMGANNNMIQAANEKVQAHFELVKSLP